MTAMIQQRPLRRAFTTSSGIVVKAKTLDGGARLYAPVIADWLRPKAYPQPLKPGVREGDDSGRERQAEPARAPDTKMPASTASWLAVFLDIKEAEAAARHMAIEAKSPKQRRP